MNKNNKKIKYGNKISKSTKNNKSKNGSKKLIQRLELLSLMMKVQVKIKPKNTTFSFECAIKYI